MSVAAGARLGPYEIVSRLGAGGMGEVWRARDARLGRDVAVKVLPPHFAGDPERLRRFELEARAAGGLNHPDIVAVYDVGTEGGAPYVVTELLVGETLRERLAGGALPLRKAVEYAVQAARGLAAAHEKGIVHRDLKPENLFVTREGRVKILDFGLAKVTVRAAATGDTATAGIGTDQGVVMGTAGYMSPEQVRGEVVDHRSDIFSFGLVLYEMLAGQRAFSRGSTVETLNAILKEEVPELPAAAHVPPALERLLLRCLEKSPAERFQGARDLAFALEAVAGASTPAAAAPRRTRRSAAVPVVAAATALAAASAFLALRSGDHGLVLPSMRRLTFRQGTLYGARFAPDGETVVYAAAWEGRPPELFSTRADNQESRALGVERADIAAISSRGEMAVARDPTYSGAVVPWRGTMMTVALSGGSLRAIGEATAQADWSPDGAALAIVRSVPGGRQLEYPVGQVLHRTVGDILYPRVSRDGERVAFIDCAHHASNGLVAVVDRRGERKALTPAWYHPRGLAWSPDGRELWFTPHEDGATPLQAVDLSGRSRVLYRFPGWATLQDVSPQGRLLVGRDDVLIGVRVGRRGGEERELGWLDGSNLAAFSVDGSQAVIGESAAAGGALGTAYLRGVDGSAPFRLGEGVPWDISADGRWVLAYIGSTPDEVRLLPTAAGEARTLARPDIVQYLQMAFFPDSRRLAFTAVDRDGSHRLYVQDVTGGPARRLGDRAVSGLYPFSPDGSRLVVVQPDGARLILPLDGGAPEAVPALLAGERVLEWVPGAHALFVVTDTPDRAPLVSRLDLKTGSRERWLRASVPDHQGLMHSPAESLVLSRGGEAYGYTYMRVFSELFVLDGLR